MLVAEDPAVVAALAEERVGGVLRAAATRLAAAGIEQAAREVRLLLAHVLGVEPSTLLAHPEISITAAERVVFDELVSRRAEREPLPYLLGIWEFYGRSYIVSPAVLIPRPETELVVETALAWPGRHARVLDVGTGSGCIAISLALERPGWRVFGMDCSLEAVAIAQENERRLSAAVSWRRAIFPSGVDDLADSLDILVSNPPYVGRGERESLQPEVRDHEPELALYAGENGLELLRALVETAPRLLRRGGWLVTEVGAGQAETVAGLLQESGRWREVNVRPDLAGIPRVVSAAFNGH